MHQAVAAFVEKLKNTEIKHKEIEAFLPAVYDKLNELSKEEVIQLLISAEFDRLLSYYRRATDINVEMKKEAGRPSAGFVRLFINLGQMEKFNERSLKAYLSGAVGIENLRISRVEVTRSCSFFETDAGQAEIIIAKLKKQKFQNRRIQIDYAEKGKGKESKKYIKPASSFFARKRIKGHRKGRY